MKDLTAIDPILAHRLGLDAKTAGRGVIDRAVAAAMKRTGITDLEAYAAHLQSSTDERQALMEDIVVPETWFFRDVGPFEYLKTCITDIRQPAAASLPLRILSAPCSTGEEPYSIVMTLFDAGLAPSEFHVDAVDISARALATARKARYGRVSFRSALSDEQKRHFQESGTEFRVSAAVMQSVHFIQDNLTAPHHLTALNPYHVIFCRNMLIYLHAAARQAVFTNLDGLLRPGGVLFSGHTETMFWLQNGYIPVRRSRTFALRKPETATVHAATSPAGVRKAPAAIQTVRHKTHPIPLHTTGQESRPAHGSGTAAHTETGPDPAPRADQRFKEARRLADRGMYDDAIVLCREYLQQAAADSEAHCLLGLIHKASGRSEEAARCFHRALYLDPGHYESLIHLSLLYQQKGDIRKASLYRDRMLRNERSIRDLEG
jgi:chemotaxis protein methyltransferase WspC